MISRVVEPSRIRRGRAATAPVWIVTTEKGERWRFLRKIDAQRFELHGCCSLHEEFLCSHCRGRKLA